MALNLKSEEADRLARELADRTGETLTQAVITALRERLERCRPRPDDGLEDDLVEDVLVLADRFSRLPVFDVRSPDEIVGYDQTGVPH
jgi:antitoxin VapB